MLIIETTEDWTQLLTWLGILFCISQSAMFSGLNLAYFSISRLRLEMESTSGNPSARKILELRNDSNFLLTTILWGNVGVNVLLAMLSDSVLAGVSAFIFSTVIITLVGEILPQAYFSRNAIKVGARLSPVLRLYQFVLYPVAKPIALLLDAWLGKEGIQYLREKDIRRLIHTHMIAHETDLERQEGLGALNFLTLDDITTSHEGEPLDPASIVTVDFKDDRPVIPSPREDAFQAFVRNVQKSKKKWVVLVDKQKTPKLVLDADGYLRDALLEPDIYEPERFYHVPIVVKQTDEVRLGSLLSRFEVFSERSGDNVIDKDIILVWGQEKRVITGADILGRLLQGIAKVKSSLQNT